MYVMASGQPKSLAVARPLFAHLLRFLWLARPPRAQRRPRASTGTLQASAPLLSLLSFRVPVRGCACTAPPADASGGRRKRQPNSRIRLLVIHPPAGIAESGRCQRPPGLREFLRAESSTCLAASSPRRGRPRAVDRQTWPDREPLSQASRGPVPTQSGGTPSPRHTPLPCAAPERRSRSPTFPASGPRPPLPTTVHATVTAHSGRKAWSRRPNRGGEAPPVAAGEWQRRRPLEPPGHASTHPPAADAIRNRARHGEASAGSRRRGGLRKETSGGRSLRRPWPPRHARVGVGVDVLRARGGVRKDAVTLYKKQCSQCSNILAS